MVLTSLVGITHSKEDDVAIDPDIQIGLGLLFTLEGSFERAGDCFGAALGELPHDPLLWNRVAVTLTNAGKADAAIPYYEAALDLHPGYIRCRVNLAVSHANRGVRSPPTVPLIVC
ncbi:hypothetical protein RQP46_005593 [Phenoliferia psychrophenolica]